MPVRARPHPSHRAGTAARRRAVVAALAAVGVLLVGAGCSTATASEVSTLSPTPSASVATGGVSLVSLGFQHGPEGFTVPAGLTLEQTVDQSNVVTLVVPAGQGRTLLDYLKAALPGMGFTITASSSDSLIFTAPGWEGAFTMSDELAGLTLRVTG